MTLVCAGECSVSRSASRASDGDVDIGFLLGGQHGPW